MKEIILLAVSALVCLQACAVVPRGNHLHEHLHANKAVTIKTVAEYTTVTIDTVIMPEVVVWVNSNGDIVSTETRTPGGAATTPIDESSTSAVNPVSTIAVPVNTSFLHINISSISSKLSVAALVSSAVATVAAPPSQPAPANNDPTRIEPGAAPSSTPGSSSKHSNGNGNGYGIAYEILDNSDECKSADTVNADFALLSTYNLVRIYDVTCNQVQLVTAQAAKYNMKVFAGMTGIDNVVGDLKSIISQAGDNLGVIDTINIGNEILGGNPPSGSVSDVTSALAAARSYLAGTAYRGALVTVDTFIAYETYPELCANSDYCAINCHAYFDADVIASGAGDYVSSTAHGIFAKGGKRTVVTESGWPYKGNTIGNAVPSEANQALAISSLKAAFSGDPQDLIIFQAFDAGYKNPGAYGVEQFWGMWDH